MAAANIAVPGMARLSTRWIIGRGVDLSLVIGSVLAGYLYLFLYASLHVPISPLWWFWSVGFDGTHIFATASRTYFDKEARLRNRRLFFGSLLFFFSLGPAMVLAGWKAWLYLLVGVWAYYHVIRQHYGFMVLYKVKNRDLCALDNRLDRLFLGVMTVVPPFRRFFIHHPEELGVPFSFPAAEVPVLTLAAVTLVVYVVRQWVRMRAGHTMNVPKFLLLLAVVPLHWLTFEWMSWRAAVPTVTLVHNLQYHALVWFHNRNRYGRESGSMQFGAVPPVVSRSLAAYLAAALLFSALYRIPGYHLGAASDLVFGLFCGFGLTHYYLDSKIWRVRHDPGLREALQLANL
jgi:hypothetical protein